MPCPREYKPPSDFSKLEIPQSSIKLEKKLGEGCFGEVWKAKYNDRVDVAVKMLKLQAQPRGKEAKALIEEAKRLHAFSHPKIVKIFGICSESFPIKVVTELMENGALSDYLKNSFTRGYSQSLNIEVLISYMNQACFLFLFLTG